MSRSSQQGSRQRGVTLIELMVACVIIGILAAIAYPSYQSQVRRSRRAAAEAFLMDLAARQQQRLVDVRSYATTADQLGTPVPTDLTSFYGLEIDAPGGPRTFRATMTAIGAQADDAGCVQLTLTNTNAKEPAECW